MRRVIRAFIGVAAAALVMAGCGGEGGGEGPPTITTHPADQPVTEGQAATFDVAATGSGTLAYQWRRSEDGGSTWTDIAGATASSYTTPATALADDGARFECVVSNAGGSTTSNVATLSVQIAVTET